MVEALEIEFIESRFFDHQTYPSFIVLFWKIHYELSQLLAECDRKLLRHNRQIIDNSEDILEPSRLAEELSLSVPLSRDLYPVSLVLRCNIRVNKIYPLLGAQDRNFLQDRTSI